MKRKLLTTVQVAIILIPALVLQQNIAIAANWSPMISGTTNTLTDIWGNSGSDVFAVGTSGTILHYDGSNWSAMFSGTTDNFISVWGSSGSDIFAVGTSGTILHYDGSNWSAMSSGITRRLNGIWGSSGSDVFAVGGGYILHYDGTGWLEMHRASQDLWGVWGSSGSDVFVVGDVDFILHYDGSNWGTMDIGTTTPLNDVWGSSGSDVFAAGSGETLHYDGLNWSPIAGITENILGVWGTSGSDVFAVGGNEFKNSVILLHYDGSVWSEMQSCANKKLTSVWGSSSTDVFVVGLNGIILHYSNDGDGDGDGDCIPDEVDDCPDSNFEEIIIIDGCIVKYGCGSNVENQLLDTGCTMNDMIAKCMENANNYDDFSVCVFFLTWNWKEKGLINEEERRAINRCAREVDIP